MVSVQTRTTPSNFCWVNFDCDHHSIHTEALPYFISLWQPQPHVFRCPLKAGRIVHKCWPWPPWSHYKKYTQCGHPQTLESGLLSGAFCCALWYTTKELDILIFSGYDQHQHLLFRTSDATRVCGDTRRRRVLSRGYQDCSVVSVTLLSGLLKDSQNQPYIILRHSVLNFSREDMWVKTTIKLENNWTNLLITLSI